MREQGNRKGGEPMKLSRTEQLRAEAAANRAAFLAERRALATPEELAAHDARQAAKMHPTNGVTVEQYASSK